MGYPVFAENRRWSENREIGLFANGPLSRFFAHFLATLPWGPFSRLWSSVSWQHRRRGGHMRNATKQGFRNDFASFYLFQPFWRVEKAWFCGPVLRTIFPRVTILYGSMFEILSKLGFQDKKPWGCRTEHVFKRAFSQFVRCARKFDARWARGRVIFFLGFGVVAKKKASRLRCGGFFRFFFSVFFFWSRFRKPQVVLFTSPSFSLGVFLFCSHSSWDWGQRRIALVFLGSWPSTLLIFLEVFWGLFTKALCFYPWKRVILVHFSVSPFRVSLSFSLASFTSLCHSLSLYLSLSLFSFLFFSSLLSCLYFYLPCFFLQFFLVLFLRFCFMKRTTSKYYIWFFINYFSLFFCFVFQICSYLCFFIL